MSCEDKMKRRRPHAVLIPYPAQGHIGPMLKLAKLLNSSPHSFHVSFVNTEHNHRRLQRAHGCSAVSGLPSFKFHVIPDGLPPAENPDATQDIKALCFSINRTGPDALRALLSRLNSESDAGDVGPGPVSCVVADSAMAFAVDVAEEFGVAAVRFWTASACALLGYAQYDGLLNKGVIPLPDSSCLTNGYLDKVVEGIPSMEGITLKHLPSFIRTTDANDFMLNYLRLRVRTVSDSPCPIIFNTFDALEDPVLQTLAATKITNTTVLTIGPLSLLSKTNTENHSAIRSSLLPEDPSCLSWLDSKPPDSVIYVNFGSVATLTPHQVMEFACGLVNSKQNFLWVIRPDLVGTSVDQPGSGAMARQLVDKAQGRGMLASWCDQETVLAHPAIGGFLTHCGWNSTIEAIGNGVAVVCWPFFADQQTNTWFCCEKWGVGVEIGGGGGEVRREEVEMVARTVVEGDQGKEMRKKAREWKRLAEKATLSPSGSSYINFEKLVDHLLGSLD